MTESSDDAVSKTVPEVAPETAAETAETASAADPGERKPAEKAPEAYRTISEVAETLDVPQHVLRFWETKFTQVKPLKRAGGRRYYRPEDVVLLQGIRQLLYGEGYTLRGVQRILREKGVRSVKAIGEGGDGSADVPEGPASSNARAASPVEAAPDEGTAIDTVGETEPSSARSASPEPTKADTAPPRSDADTPHQDAGAEGAAATDVAKPAPSGPSPEARARLEEALRLLDHADTLLTTHLGSRDA